MFTASDNCASQPDWALKSTVLRGVIDELHSVLMSVNIIRICFHEQNNQKYISKTKSYLHTVITMSPI